MKTTLLNAALAFATLGASPASAAENMVGFQTQNEGFFAIPAPGPVVIDGDASDWDLSGRVHSYGDASVKDVYSVKTAAMWDASHLYLLFDWRDPTPMTSRIDPAFDPGRGWIADAEQLRFLVGDKVFWTTSWIYDRRVPALGYDAMSAADLWKPAFLEQYVLHRKDGGTELGRGFASAYRLASDGRGFAHELRIPWSALHIVDPAVGFAFRMGMEFLWGKPSGDTFPEHRYADNMQPGVLSREFYWTAKHAWGDVTLLDRPVDAPRRYVPDVPVVKGAIPVEINIPACAVSFTLAIENAEGRRVRNLVGGADPSLYAVSGELRASTRRLRVMWDGLDDAGGAVPPARYAIRALALDTALHGTYERCFYNPGTPPWATANRAGSWMADHSAVHRVAAAGDRMVAWCEFAEGGAGAIGIGPDGRKLWGDIRGADLVDASSRHAFSVPNDWNTAGTLLLRLDAATGAFAPFMRDGRALPMPLPFADLIGSTQLMARALAASDDALVLATSDGALRVFDPETAAPLRVFPGTCPPNAFPCALRNTVFYRADGARLAAIDVRSGEISEIALQGDLPAQPVALDAAPDGSFYVLDGGPDCRVKRYAADGAFLSAFGRKGGRPGQGAFVPEGLYHPADVAVDAAGNVWVAEDSRRPRRLSVWRPDGSLLRDYVGNAAYAASGTGLHDSDPAIAFAEGNEIRFDTTPRSRAWRVSELMQTPDTSLVGSAVGDPPPAIGDGGRMFFSEASGRRREYFVSPGDWGAALVVLLRDDDSGSWRTVCAIANIANIQRRYGGEYGAQIVGGARGQFADCDPADLVLWTDRNGDELVQRAECEIAPAIRPTDYGPGTRAENGDPSLPALHGKGWSRPVDPADFSFYAAGTRNMPGVWCVAPASFTEAGAPVFTRDCWRKVPLDAAWRLEEAFPIPGAASVLAFVNRDPEGRPDMPSNWLVRFDRDTGRIRWAYPSPYHGVHGSHDSPMASPGLLIGCLKICGVVRGNGAPDAFMVRGNLGEDYWLTTEGLFISAFFKDGRLPAPALPDTEEDLAAVPFESLSGGSEHFCGWAGRQADGVARVSCGISREAGMVFRLDGLDSVREIPASTLDVTAGDAARAADERANRNRRTAAADSIRIPQSRYAGESGVIDWSAVSEAFVIRREGLVEQARLRLCWDADALRILADIRDPVSPWKNAAKDPTLLFIGGDALDVSLRPSDDAGGPAREGDFRVVAAPRAGASVALMLREKAPGAQARNRRIYSSPVSTVVFDAAALSDTVSVSATPTGDGVRVEMAIPWPEIGLAPAPGAVLRGDFGLLSSDRAGTETTGRVYRFRAGANLVSDIPSEARLAPETWGRMILE